jgi:hypothetical protein
MEVTTMRTFAGPKTQSSSAVQASALTRPTANYRIVSATDASEREADRAAEAVMSDSSSEGGVLPKPDAEPERIQRKCAECEDEEVMRKEAPGATSLGVTAASSELGTALDATRGGGVGLSPDVRTDFETQMGHDFSNVRVHTDSRAGELSHGVGALAFTVGRDIYFDAGRFSPETASGKRLLAHELAHTVQQGASAELPPKARRG